MRTLVGRPRMIAVDAHRRTPLGDGWLVCSTPAGTVSDPTALDASIPLWSPAIVPGTVAEAVRATEGLDLERVPDFDTDDWWYRCVFAAEPNASPGSRVLQLEGLATLADVWLNGQHVLTSDNMFVAYEIDVSSVVAAYNTFVIRFRSVSSALGARRQRPRWRTKLVEHQQLRWIRTTLLGRIPGWSPAVRAVGPWRPVALESRESVAVERGDILASLEPDGSGLVSANVTVRRLAGTRVSAAILDIAGQRFALGVTSDDSDLVELTGLERLAGIRPWWPHTHGDQPLYEARIILATDQGRITLDFGHIAFRTIDVATEGGEFTVSVNGVRVFCRGACWATPDLVSLGATAERYESLLSAAREAGMNMIRVGGTMTYESDVFYDTCDRLGILVWQDFMFANMDYPADDPAFVTSVRDEVTGVLARLRRHPSVAIVCGGNEIEQQAAMVGIAREQWGGALFHRIIPDFCATAAPNVAYWPASPGGGVLPFHAEQGVAHYYGVGAYLRPLEDARRSGVRFATECLAFANVPDQSVVEALLPSGEAPVHHPRWKARVPRDHGAGWDFDDVRDHYLELLFGVNPARLRYSDPERYLALSRVVTGEVMSRTIGEWRRGASSCAGALVWFFQDVWPGAGWGVLDSSGRPKAAFYALKRAMQPVAIAITDEGVNGLHVHVANDRPVDLEGDLRLSLYRNGCIPVTARSCVLRVAAHGTACVSADAVLEQFHDTSYAYRFGAPGHDLVVASFNSIDVRTSEAFHFPLGMPSEQHGTLGLTADAERQDDGSIALTIRTDRFAQFVEIDCDDVLPDDNYFHIAPGGERVVMLRARADVTVADGFLKPLNAHSGLRFEVGRKAGASV